MTKEHWGTESTVCPSSDGEKNPTLSTTVTNELDLIRGKTIIQLHAVIRRPMIRFTCLFYGYRSLGKLIRDLPAYLPAGGARPRPLQMSVPCCLPGTLNHRRWRRSCRLGRRCCHRRSGAQSRLDWVLDLVLDCGW